MAHGLVIWVLDAWVVGFPVAHFRFGAHPAGEFQGSQQLRGNQFGQRDHRHDGSGKFGSVENRGFFQRSHPERDDRTGLNGNQELKILGENFQIANNEVQARRGAFLPFFNIGGGAGMSIPSRFTTDGAVESTLNILPGQPFPNPLPDFLVASSFSWQLDIWRQLRNARDAAIYRYFGTAEGRTMW